MKKSLILGIVLLIFNLSAFPQSGTIVTDTIHSQILDTSVEYSLYLPPSFYNKPEKMYPTLYLLHGYGGNNRELAYGGGINYIMDTLVQNGCQELIIIIPNGLNSFYCNDYDNRKLKYEDFFIQEFIPSVETKYRGIALGSMRSIAGYSMGGYGATYHAFKYPDMFSSSYSMSGAVLTGGKEPNLQVLLDSKTEQELQSLPAYVMEIGTEDFLYSYNVRFHNLLLNKQIDHQWITREGTHNWAFWQVCMPKVFRFASENFGKTSEVKSISTDEEAVIYPNPATKWIHIKSSSVKEVVLCDLQYQEILRKTIRFSTTIDVSKLHKGIYLMLIKNPNKTLVRKIVIM